MHSSDSTWGASSGILPTPITYAGSPQRKDWRLLESASADGRNREPTELQLLLLNDIRVVEDCGQCELVHWSYGAFTESQSHLLCATLRRLHDPARGTCAHGI